MYSRKGYTMGATGQKEVLTTGEVARICRVAPRTVSKWFDTGKLRGYRIPGSRDRRIVATIEENRIDITCGRIKGLSVMLADEMFDADDLLDRGRHCSCEKSMTGRTSTFPCQAPGIWAAHCTASSRSAHCRR